TRELWGWTAANNETRGCHGGITTSLARICGMRGASLNTGEHGAPGWGGVCYGTDQCAPNSAWKLVAPESNDPEIAAVATAPRGRSTLMVAARKIAAIGRATTK